MLIRIWAYLRLKRILKALGLQKLTPRQMRAILHDDMQSLWGWERQSGKTTAAIIYMLLWRDKALLVREEFPWSIPDPDLTRVPTTKRFVYKELKEAHKKCEAAGIRVFKLVGRL